MNEQCQLCNCQLCEHLSEIPDLCAACNAFYRRVAALAFQSGDGHPWATLNRAIRAHIRWMRKGVEA